MSTVSILKEVRNERRRQDEKWGEVQAIPNGTGGPGRDRQRDMFKALTDRKMERGTVTFLDVLQEEVAEAFAETDPDRLREELIQSAAVCVKWAEAIDRQKGVV